MHHIPFVSSARSSSLGARHLCFLCLMAFLSVGCQPKDRSPADLSNKYQQDYEEVVHEPYIPRDDGIPLTPAEFKAFNSRGKIDAKLSQDDAEIVELHFKFFVHEHRRTFERYLERSARFLPHIKKVFTDRGIPEEIAYLSMVESGGNPNAISPVGATGLWQFMPFTGKKFGLTQTTWLDERRDPFKATYAAADYLLKLYNDFSDWHLAIAAYNAGEGKIGRAVSGTGAKDFFELCRLDSSLEEKQRLRDETRQYVPRLLAIAKIMRNLKSLGFSEPSPDDAWKLETLEVPPGTSLSGLARNVGLTWDEFSSMNPAFKRTASPPTMSTVAYITPDKKDSAAQWLASNESRIYAGWREYTVRKNDSLNSISKRNGITVADLRQANNINKLPKAGSVILIPGKGQSVEPVYAALPEQSSAPAASAGKYTVQTGDTLFTLAQSWGTDVNSIRLANRLGTSETRLTLGQRLSVPGNSKHVPIVAQRTESSGPPKSNYIVKSGDTLFAIARTCNVSIQDLCEANGFDRNNITLKVGQSVRIPDKGKGAQASGTAQAAAASGKTPAGAQAGKTPAAQAGKAPATAQSGKAPVTQTGKTPAVAQTPAGKKPAGGNAAIVVAQGDTLFSLSRKYNTTVDALRQANGLGKKGNLKVGQKLMVP